ncbi:hypothetical protein [Acidipila sp. EB88]|uniref:hypothetical protein n=1 Tax=Acidipila sp. EB88 TaxID=2305226 RepID=UPI000F5DCC96|nr:hypothetical protein [Acidipila sp. EB88]
MDKAFDWFFYTFVFITVFLPGGSIYGVNFKYPLYVGLLPLAAYALFQRRQAHAGQLALLLAVPAILSGWMILGLSHGFSVPSVARQYTDILLTLLLCWLAGVSCDQKDVRRLAFLKLILYSELATAVLKIGLIVYAVVRGIPVVQMVLWLDTVFGVELMTMDLGALFGRVQFISDELIPICIFILLRYRDRLRISHIWAALMIVLLLASVLFSFSRYFWGFTAFAFFLGLVLGKRDKFQAVLVAVLGLTILASLPALVAVYKLRFSTEVAGGSDQQRNAQIPALEHFFIEAPIFGHGLGSYTTEDIRGTTEAGRASYEVQLLALPAQIGLAGMCFFIVLGAFYYRALWWKSSLHLSDQVSLLLLLAFWLAAGLTNPLIFHPIAGVNYATLATLSAMGLKGRPFARRSASLLHATGSEHDLV